MSTFIFVEKVRRFVVREFVKLSDEFDIYLFNFFSQLSPNAVVLSALFLTTTFLDLQTFTSIFTNFLQAQDLLFDSFNFKLLHVQWLIHHFPKVPSYVKSEQISDYCLGLTQNS